MSVGNDYGDEGTAVEVRFKHFDEDEHPSQRTLSFAVRAYQVLKEATLMRVFQALREGKIVFTHPLPTADIVRAGN